MAAAKLCWILRQLDSRSCRRGSHGTSPLNRRFGLMFSHGTDIQAALAGPLTLPGVQSVAALRTLPDASHGAAVLVSLAMNASVLRMSGGASRTQVRAMTVLLIRA